MHTRVLTCVYLYGVTVQPTSVGLGMRARVVSTDTVCDEGAGTLYRDRQRGQRQSHTGTQVTTGRDRGQKEKKRSRKFFKRARKTYK